MGVGVRAFAERGVLGFISLFSFRFVGFVL